MVKIRLARFGKKKQPTYRIVVSDVRKDTRGTYIESVGSYNPSVQPKEISINLERAKYWLSQGAQPTDVVHNLFVDHGISNPPKRSVGKSYVPKPETSEDEQQSDGGEQKDTGADKADSDNGEEKQSAPTDEGATSSDGDAPKNEESDDSGADRDSGEQGDAEGEEK